MIAKFYDVDLRPPRGGWSVVIEGVPFDGTTETEVFGKLKVWRANNGTLKSDAAMLEEMWEIYRAREPERAIAQVAMPGVVQRAANLAGAVARTVGAVVTGKPVLQPQSESDRRLSICGGCVYFSAGYCHQCGCALSAKVALAQEHCPFGKW